MRERIVSYFKTNKWWILTFLIFVLADSGLTLYILINTLGVEANPFIGGNMFDWSWHFFRIDIVFFIIPVLSMLKWPFARNWLLQGCTVGYAWTIANEISIILFKTDINIYQFLPSWAYLFGVLFQFFMGIVILWVYRNIQKDRQIANA